MKKVYEIFAALARLRAEEEERKRREEEEKMANLARIEREKYEQLEREQLEWERYFMNFCFYSSF